MIGGERPLPPALACPSKRCASAKGKFHFESRGHAPPIGELDRLIRNNPNRLGRTTPAPWAARGRQFHSAPPPDRLHTEAAKPYGSGVSRLASACFGLGLLFVYRESAGADGCPERAPHACHRVIIDKQTERDHG